jgi:hypothetical protein
VSVKGELKEEKLSYKQAIARTEERVKDLGYRVHVSIRASPGSCNVKYHPVIGGAEMDAGATDVTAMLDARWYVFFCDCISPPLSQKVDCTDDTTISFGCQKAKQKKLPSSTKNRGQIVGVENPILRLLVVLADQLAAPPHAKGERLVHGDPALGVERQNALRPLRLVARLPRRLFGEPFCA